MNWKREYKKVQDNPDYFLHKYFLPIYPALIGDIEQRKQKFVEDLNTSVAQNTQGATPTDINGFINYWTVVARNGKQMKFEREDTFDFPGRLRTWMQNKKKFNTIKILRNFGSQIR